MEIKMIQFNDTAKSYKTIENAKKQLEKFADQFEKFFGTDKVSFLRCGISARDDGRFVPYILFSSLSGGEQTTFVIHNKHGVCLLG